MIKELKYLLFIFIISLFIFLTLKFYFSDMNKKNSYRSFMNNEERIIKISKKLIFLENNTINVVEYVEKIIDKDKRKYNFWELINTNGK
tara:strand:- start:17 stop:283 length:267 start_codon:yes stop_codon:yes gene_type:complete